MNSVYRQSTEIIENITPFYHLWKTKSTFVVTKDKSDVSRMGDYDMYVTVTFMSPSHMFANWNNNNRAPSNTAVVISSKHQMLT